MKNYFFASIISFISSCLSIHKQSISGSIERIKITYKSPEKVVDNIGISFTSEFYISYRGQYTIYELPYHVTKQINNELIYDSTKYEYLICNKQHNMGYMVKQLTDSIGKKIAVDSIIATRAMGGGAGNLDVFAELKIKSVNKIEDTNLVIYKYLFDNYSYDSAYFYYKDELKDVKFSFSKKMDSAHNSKLSKMQFFIKHDTINQIPGLKNFYINSFEIESAPNKNEQALKDFIERVIKKEVENF